METIVEVLIDNSNSMGSSEDDKGIYLLQDGSTRMELAKKILVEEIIPCLDYAKKLTLRKFHSTTSIDKKRVPVFETVYEGVFDKITVSSKIKDIPIPKKTGSTPITAAVKLSISALAKYPGTDRKIILVTDGQETDGGDYKQTAEDALKQYGIPCNIFIVGIAQDLEAESKSKALAESTGGGYVNLESKTYDKAGLRNELRSVYLKVINTSIQNITIKPPISIAPLPGQQTRTPSASEIIEEANRRIEIDYIEIIQNSSVALYLIAKQIVGLTEAIENLNKNDRYNNTKIEITANIEPDERIKIAGESYLYNKLKEKFSLRIKWLNETQESGKAYDFEVLDILDNTVEYFILCKATIESEKKFTMTKTEWLFFLENKNKYQIYFIFNALTNPQVIKIDNLTDWIFSGKLLPFSNKNIRLTAERILFTIKE